MDLDRRVSVARGLEVFRAIDRIGPRRTDDIALAEQHTAGGFASGLCLRGKPVHMRGVACVQLFLPVKPLRRRTRAQCARECKNENRGASLISNSVVNPCLLGMRMSLRSSPNFLFLAVRASFGRMANDARRGAHAALTVRKRGAASTA